MSSSAPYMPLFVADYLADTSHLSTLQHGAYLLLLMHYWRKGELPMDDRQLAHVARMTLKQWQANRAVIASFFDDEWRHRRVEKERDKVSAKSQVRAEAGAIGGRSKALKRKDAELAKATDLPEHTDGKALPSSSDINFQKEDTGKPASSGAGQPEIDLFEAEKRCLQAAGRDKLGPFTPIAEVLQRGLLDLEDDVLPLIRARSAHDWSSWKYLAGALRDAEIAKPDPNAPKPQVKVFIAVGTPQWDAWTVHNKKPLPTGKDGNGWWQPTEWPPGFTPAASPGAGA